MPDPSRYATRQEALCREFLEINADLDVISGKYNLPDHSEINRERFPWCANLNRPEFYASRLWEYPWAILESNVSKGMMSADVGCGQSPFTIYLKEIVGSDVTGFDPDFGAGRLGERSHGVPSDYSVRTGIRINPTGIEALDAEDESFDRVFCISVIEHIARAQDRADGMREIARVLKPGGLALITVDVNLMKRIVNPLSLIWESGLLINGPIDLLMPVQRYGIFNDGSQPADVFGFVLVKPTQQIELNYGQSEPRTNAWHVGHLRDSFPPEWASEIDVPAHLSPLARDWTKDRTSLGHPSVRTLLRIATKAFRRRYPPYRGPEIP